MNYDQLNEIKNTEQSSDISNTLNSLFQLFLGFQALSQGYSIFLVYFEWQSSVSCAREAVQGLVGTQKGH